MSLDEYTKKRFLIVDQLDSFCFSTKKILKELGLKLVDTANSAQKVITGFENINYDVVLCNYDLGKGKNGQELLEELRYRKLLKFTGLFYIVSAEVEKQKVMGTIENEPDGYLVKPVTPKDLESRLAKSLKMKEAMRQIETAMDEGDFMSAIHYCDRKIQEQDPYIARIMKTKAWLYLKTGQFELAKNMYATILSQQAFMWAEYGLAKTHFKMKEYDSASKVLTRILEKDPEQLEALDMLAEISKTQHHFKDAQAYLKKAISLSPNSLIRQKELADLCVLNQDDEDAAEAFKKMHKLSEQSVYAKPEQYIDYANFLIEQAKKHSDNPAQSPFSKQAFELTESVKKRFSTQTNIQDQSKLAGAYLHWSLGDSDTANSLIEAVLTPEHIDELDPRTLKIAAKVVQATGNSVLSEQLLEKAADQSKHDPKLIAEIYEQLNKHITTEDRIEAAMKNKAGIQHYSDNQLDEAITILKDALKLTPRHISLNLNLIQVLLKSYKQTHNSDTLQEVSSLLNKIRHIPEDHRERRRYQYLLNRFQSCNN